MYMTRHICLLPLESKGPSQNTQETKTIGGYLNQKGNNVKGLGVATFKSGSSI